MELEVETWVEDGYTVVKPRGEMDLSTVSEFRGVLDELVIQGHVHLLVDLDDLDFIDSLGLGALVGARRRAHAVRGYLGVVCSAERILRLLRVTGLDRVFNITASVSAQPAVHGAARARSAGPSDSTSTRLS